MNERAVLVLLVAALAGCAGSGENLVPLRGGDAPHAPYIREFKDALSPQYNRTYSFPVDAGAASLNLTASLATRSGGVVPGGATPASATIVLRDPTGVARGQAQLDPAHANATLLLPAPLAAGSWRLDVTGSGDALDAQAIQVSTVYSALVSVRYA